MATGMCDPSIAGVDYLTNFEFIKAFVCVFAEPAGLLVVGLIVWTGISLAIYARQGSVVVPTILLLLTAGATMTTMASPAITVAGLLVLVIGPGVVVYALYRYSR